LSRITNKGVKMKEDIKVIKQYIKTFNDRKLREEYRLYTSLERPTILENYFKDFIKQEIDTRGIGI
jgi:hypothetical protein